MFADDTVIFCESEDQVEARLEKFDLGGEGKLKALRVNSPARLEKRRVQSK